MAIGLSSAERRLNGVAAANDRFMVPLWQASAICRTLTVVGKKLTSQPCGSSSRMYWLVSGFDTLNPLRGRNSSMPSSSPGSRDFACEPWPA